MRGYLPAVRRFFINEKMEPIPSTPTESDILMDTFKAANWLESQMLVRKKWGHVGILAADTMAVLPYEKRVVRFGLKKMKSMWILMSCFSFRGGTTVA